MIDAEFRRCIYVIQCIQATGRASDRFIMDLVFLLVFFSQAQ